MTFFKKNIVYYTKQPKEIPSFQLYHNGAVDITKGRIFLKQNYLEETPTEAYSTSLKIEPNLVQLNQLNAIHTQIMGFTFTPKVFTMQLNDRSISLIQINEENGTYKYGFSDVNQTFTLPPEKDKNENYIQKKITVSGGIITNIEVLTKES